MRLKSSRAQKFQQIDPILRFSSWLGTIFNCVIMHLDVLQWMSSFVDTYELFASLLEVSNPHKDFFSQCASLSPKSIVPATAGSLLWVSLRLCWLEKENCFETWCTKEQNFFFLRSAFYLTRALTLNISLLTVLRCHGNIQSGDWSIVRVFSEAFVPTASLIGSRDFYRLETANS